MDDLELLKAIKDKENDTSREISEFKARKEAEIRALEETLRNRYLNTEKELEEEREKLISTARKEAEEEAARIIEMARIRASRMALHLTGEELASIFDAMILDYLGVE